MPFGLCMISATLNLVLGGYQFTTSFLNNGSTLTGIATLAFGAWISIASSQMYLRPAQHILWSIAVLAASIPVLAIAFALPNGGGLSWTIHHSLTHTISCFKTRSILPERGFWSDLFRVARLEWAKPLWRGLGSLTS